jgi:putative GTP pyrophosphokinase
VKENRSIPNQAELRKAFERQADIRALVSMDLENSIEDALRRLPSPPFVKSRIKNFSSYYKKYLHLLRQHKGNEESVVITDLIGLRIICLFIEDITRVQETIQKKFEVLEVDRKGSNHTFREFGYQSTHLLIRIPQEILEKRGKLDFDVAEIQIRTILQDAWAEVEHELVYKAEFTPFDDPIKHKLAAVNASLSLADIIFQEIRNYQRQLNGQMGMRRDAFFKKIGETTDAAIFEQLQNEEPLSYTAVSSGDAANASMDDMLLNALYAHNKNQFDEAIKHYSRILEISPNDSVRSLVYKHRGMANFAQSHYEDAIADFSHVLESDPNAYKAFYYRGIVKAVLLQYSEAAEDFSRSLGINPYQSFTLYRRAQVYYHLEDYPQALADCEAALALEPGNESVEKFRHLILKKLQM